MSTSRLSAALPRRKLLLAALAGVIALLGLLVGPAHPAPAATTGWIRLAHLSPDTPEVDVYLASFAKPDDAQVIRGVGYGMLSPYQRIAEGTYTVSMRSPGAEASSPPLLSTSVEVTAGRAYTVAGIGRQAELELRVLTDDLTKPPAGQARVRVVHAAMQVPEATVTATRGGDSADIVDAARFATASDYATVPAGRWTLQIAPAAGGDATTAAADLKPGGVYTVLVLDDSGDGLQVLTRTDSMSAGVVPSGAIQTGGGGTAVAPVSAPAPVVPAAALVAGLALLAGLGSRARRSRGSR